MTLQGVKLVGPPPSPPTRSGPGRARAWLSLLLLVPLLAACVTGGPNPPPPPGQGDVLWTTYLSSPSHTYARGVAAHVGGGVVVSGYTFGAVAGTNLGLTDSLLARIGDDGAVVWVRQFGGQFDEAAVAVASDLEGNAIVVGSTSSDLDGPHQGNYDAYVTKHGPGGELLWTRQFGGPSQDHALGVATGPDGEVTVGGWTQNTLADTKLSEVDAFLRMYDAAGNEVWTRQFGTTADDSVTAVATRDNGAIAVAGWTRGVLDTANAGLDDAFVRMYFDNGQAIFTRQFGTAQVDVATAVKVDSQANVIVAGYTYGSLTGITNGAADAFVRKYDLNGTLLWTRQFGTAADDFAYGVTNDADDNVIVVGSTSGDLAGEFGDQDAFIRVCDPDGNELWTRQFGSGALTVAQAAGVAVSEGGDIVVAGLTRGHFDGTPSPIEDAFIRGYAP